MQPPITIAPDAGARPAEEPPRLLTYSEAAERLRVDERTIYNMVRRGELPAAKLGSRRNCAVRIDPRDLAAYIDASKGRRR